MHMFSFLKRMFQKDAPNKKKQKTTFSSGPSVTPNMKFVVQGIKYCFDSNEFRDLCLELGVSYENLSGVDLQKARELIQFLSRRRRLNELLTVCSRLRPKIDWHSEGKFSEPYQLNNLAAFQQLLVDNIDEETIRQFSKRLDINYKRLPEWDHGGLARELVLYLARRSRLEELVALCNEQLPELPWNDVLFAQNVSPNVKAQGKSVDPIKMKQELSQLSENSLRTLCLHLGINYDNLPRSNPSDELLSLMQRQLRMPDLANVLDNLPDDV